MRTASKTDLNHATIRDELRQLGFTVHDTHALGHGYPDLHVSKNGWATLVEVKSSKRASLTQDEHDFRGSWQGPYIIATNTEAIIEQFNWWTDDQISSLHCGCGGHCCDNQVHREVRGETRDGD